MRMKKLTLTLIALAAAVTAFAQIPSGLSIGAGYGSTTKIMKMKEMKIDEKEKLDAFFAGAEYNFAIGNSGLGVAPGIYFQYSKGDFLGEMLGGADDIDWKESSILVPLKVNYSIPVADILKIVPYLGPTLEYNISSKASKDGETEDLYDLEDDGGKYKHLQLYLGGGVAFDIADIVRVSIGYEYGLLNRLSIDIFDENDADYSFKDTGRLSVGVAYLF